jgi:hypothetical protein
MKRTILEYGLLALLIWSPLPAASVEEWSIFVVELVVAVMAAAYVLLGERPSLNPRLPPVLKSLRPLVAAFFGYHAPDRPAPRPGSSGSTSPGTYGFQKLYRPVLPPDEVHEACRSPRGRPCARACSSPPSSYWASSS